MVINNKEFMVVEGKEIMVVNMVIEYIIVIVIIVIEIVINFIENSKRDELEVKNFITIAILHSLAIKFVMLIF